MHQVSPNSGGDGSSLWRAVLGVCDDVGEKTVSSGLYAHRPDELGEIAVVPAAQRAVMRETAQIWHDLIHELATVRALSAAALDASDDSARVAMLMLIEAETDEATALAQQLRADPAA